MYLKSFRLRLAALVVATAVVSACTEDLDNSAGCPLLCSDQGGQIETVTLDPVVLDTTVTALTGLGTEASLLLATRGDTIDSRAVIRFDSIPARFQRLLSDTTTTAITTVDSAFIRLRVDTVGGRIPPTVILDAFDVDSPAGDTLVAPVAALFRADRLIGSRTYAATQLKDTLIFALPPEAILNRRGGRLRVGLRARSTGSVQLRILSIEGSAAPTLLSFRVSADTAVRPIVLFPYSKTPADQPAVAASLADYTLLVKGTPPGPIGTLNVGGLPASRAYLRFVVPAFLIDSADIVRASLLLTQRPNRGVGALDTILVIPHVSLAGKAVTDVARAAQITAVAASDSLRLIPQDSGLKTLEIAGVISLWRAQNVEQTPRAIVLVSTREGQTPLEAQFFSTEAAPGLRPRLRISYSKRQSGGLP
ncbi:MAG: hypothetical protein ABIR58_04225 [Gemmatimonadaceae bacterium]